MGLEDMKFDLKSFSKTMSCFSRCTGCAHSLYKTQDLGLKLTKQSLIQKFKSLTQVKNPDIPSHPDITLAS